MHTLVLDLHGGLPALGAADVVLYRPRAEGRLAWLGGPALVSATDTDLAEAGASVRTHLARRGGAAWQLVALLALPAGGDALDGSALTDQLDRLQRGVLAPLAAAGWRPARVVALALDGLDRDHRGVPTDAAARLRWKLDTYGMARVARDIDALLEAPERDALDALVDRHPALLNEADLADVVAAWTRPRRPPGVRLDQRLATLAPELRAALNAGRTAVLSALDRHLGLADASASEGPASRFVRRGVLRQVRDRFAEALDALRTVEAWQGFDPAATLRRIVRHTLSADALAHDTVRLRLRLDRQPAPALQRSLLRLAYAVAALAEVADRADLLKSGQSYVAEVELDDERLSALADAYGRRLDRALRDVRHRLDEPLVTTVAFVDDPDCGCARTLDLRGRYRDVERWARVGPVRGADDLRWDTWAERITADLDAAEAEADAHIEACVREEAARFPAPQPRRLDRPAEAVARDEAEAFRAQQRALLATVVPPRGAGWDAAAHGEAVAPRLYSRPVGRVVALWALGGAVVLALPYLAETLATPTPFAEERAWWLGGLALSGLLVAVAVLVGRWVTLRRRWRAAARAAKEALAAVQARYRLRTDRLAQGCALRAAHQRVEAARAAEQEAGRQRLLLRFHETQLQQHQRLAADLRGRLPDADAAAFAEAPADAPDTLDPARPVYANAVYHLTHRPGPPGDPARLVVNRSEHALDTPRLAGLAALRLNAE